MGIPLYILEEHHEAFIAWYDALKKKMFSTGDNVLLHIDSHADIKCFPYMRPMPSIDDPVDMVTNFTYEELTISSFIIPAIFSGFFNQVVWLMPECADIGKNLQHYNVKTYSVRSYKQKRQVLLVEDNPFEGFQIKPGRDQVPFMFRCSTVKQVLNITQHIILDIDLDYFCCSSTVNRSEKIEITKNEYDRCRNEKYRTLNLHYRTHLEVSDGRYFLLLAPGTGIVEKKEYDIDENTIDKNIGDLLHYLQENKIQPLLITISRSRYSGYTPFSVWEKIEQILIKKLSEIYTIDNQNFLS